MDEDSIYTSGEELAAHLLSRSSREKSRDRKEKESESGDVLIYHEPEYRSVKEVEKAIFSWKWVGEKYDDQRDKRWEAPPNMAQTLIWLSHDLGYIYAKNRNLRGRRSPSF